MFEDIVIPTYIINLKERSDRLEHALIQFSGKTEFEIHVTEARKHKIGAVGLWESIVNIVSQVIDGDDDVIIICEDDHTFTEHYNRDEFIKNLIDASEQRVELLSGGIGGFGCAVPITKNRFWIDWFWCTQFIVLYRPIFHKILNYNFMETDTADGVLSEITSHKMVIYPFLSVQTDFGYSDVTRSNDKINGMISKHFNDAKNKMNVYYKAYLRFLDH